MNKNPEQLKEMDKILSKIFNPQKEKIQKINKEVSDIIQKRLNKEWKKQQWKYHGIICKHSI